MLYNIVTVFLMTTALMPPAILQYYAFEPLLKHRQKVLVLGGYAVLYLMELIFFLYMFIWGPWEHSFILYKKIFVIAWIPHFLWPSQQSGLIYSAISTSFPSAQPVRFSSTP